MSDILERIRNPKGVDWPATLGRWTGTAVVLVVLAYMAKLASTFIGGSPTYWLVLITLFYSVESYALAKRASKR